VFADHTVKGLAKILSSHLYTSEVIRGSFWGLLVHPEVPFSSLEWAINTYGNSADARVFPDGYSSTLSSIGNNQWDKVEVFARKGANLHLVGIDSDFSPVEETPTSLSLYNSDSFFHWRNILRRLGSDIKKFIEDEILQYPLKQDGWDAQSLATLFELEFCPVKRDQGSNGCPCCCRNCIQSDIYSVNEKTDVDDNDIQGEKEEEEEGGGDLSICGETSYIMVEAAWQTLLLQIKEGKSLEGYIDKYLEPSDLNSQNGGYHSQDVTEVSERKNSDGEGRYIDGCKDEQDEKIWKDVNEDTQGDEESITEDINDEEEDEDKWYCLTCWYDECTRSDTSSSLGSEIESVDSDDEDSPMLLKI